ncbi:MAG: AAA family ATPase [Clostridia bacterium]|nr:AAA family ATPase [Clostridia bacterium]
MDLGFLSKDILSAIGNLNLNYLSEIRLRISQPVIVEYRGEYKYLYAGGVTVRGGGAIICNDVQQTLYRAMGGCVYSFAEQLKDGFITVSGGVRIGVAGEYVTENGEVKTIKNASSLNIRIPHDVGGCSGYVFNKLLKDRLCSVLLFSAPGCGKTTMLRDIVKNISAAYRVNILVLDVRNEISGGQGGYNLGDGADVVLSCDKLASVKSAIRAMKPDIIVTDELYGENDYNAMRYAADCGIYAIASSHICNRKILKDMPFEYFVCLTGINRKAVIYDKDFNIVGDSGAYDVCGRAAFCGKKEENENI